MPPEPSAHPVEVAVQAAAEKIYKLIKPLLGEVEDVFISGVKSGLEAAREVSIKCAQRKKPKPEAAYRVARSFEFAIEPLVRPPKAMVTVTVSGKGAVLVKPYDPNTGKAIIRFDTFSSDAKDIKTVCVEGRGKARELSFIVSPFQTIWAHYPDQHFDLKKRTHDPCKQRATDGTLKWKAQCGARFSQAIEQAGFSTATLKRNHDGSARLKCGCADGVGVGGRPHLLRAEELANWLRHSPPKNLPLGTREVKRGEEHAKTTGVTWKNYKNRYGIVFFKDFWGNGNDHIDLWHGDWPKQGSDGQGNGKARHDYFERSTRVWFWPLH